MDLQSQPSKKRKLDIKKSDISTECDHCKVYVPILGQRNGSSKAQFDCKICNISVQLIVKPLIPEPSIEENASEEEKTKDFNTVSSTSSQRLFKCEYCQPDNTRYTPEELQKHQVANHSSELKEAFKLIKCEYCKHYFNQAELQDHQCSEKQKTISDENENEIVRSFQENFEFEDGKTEIMDEPIDVESEGTQTEPTETHPGAAPKPLFSRPLEANSISEGSATQQQPQTEIIDEPIDVQSFESSEKSYKCKIIHASPSPKRKRRRVSKKLHD